MNWNYIQLINRAQACFALRRPAALILLLVWAALAAVPAGAAAGTDDPVARGLALFQAADARQSGYGDLTVDVQMVLRNAAGGRADRLLELRQIEVAGAGDRSLVVFETPKAIQGTGLLSHGQAHREDDQWLYLPALKRVKKIASRNRSGPFLGSEFAFEDLATQEVAKYVYRWLAQEPCPEAVGLPAGLTCDRIERRPGPTIYSGYLRQEFLIDRQQQRTLRIDYFNRGDRLTKTLLAEQFIHFPEVDQWRPRFMHMQNHITRKSTELHWDNFRFAAGLRADRDFSTASLLRIR